MRYLPYNKYLNNYARKLRKSMTQAEKKIWQFLRTLPYQVLRQRIIDNFIIDFYCAHFKLVIEIDGDSHYTDDGISYDEERTKFLESYGLKVIRFSNIEIMNNFEGVCDSILKIINTK